MSKALHSPLHVPLEPPETKATKHQLRWKFPKNAGGFTLQGASRAAASTAFCVEELNWFFDVGALPGSHRPDHVFITHTHSDHIFQLPYVRSRRKQPDFYLPFHAVEPVEHYLNAAQQLTDNASLVPGHSFEKAYTLHGVKPGDELRPKKGFVVKVVGCEHTVPCVGYLVYEERHKLKSEFAGLPGHELAELRKKGVQFTKALRKPLFAYLGDTTPKVFEDHPEILEMPLVITECTFLDAQEHKEQADRTKHTLWADLEPLVTHHPETFFVLIHFSHRYKNHEIKKFFEEQALENVLPWVP